MSTATMSFSKALKKLKKGASVQRVSWIDECLDEDRITLIEETEVRINRVSSVDGGELFPEPCFYRIDWFNSAKPWLPSMEDLLANDWVVFKGTWEEELEVEEE